MFNTNNSDEDTNEWQLWAGVDIAGQEKAFKAIARRVEAWTV